MGDESWIFWNILNSRMYCSKYITELFKNCMLPYSVSNNLPENKACSKGLVG